jgi:chromate reductase, NAD(P)H dehydrogenase (quinone)
MDTGARTTSGRVLLVSGSTRAGSTNTALLRTVEAAPPPGVEPVRYLDMAALPHFNPDDDADPLPTAVADLRGAIAAADAVLFCTPEYAGALPGTFKNLLDWTVGGIEMYRKPVASVNVSGSSTRAAGAHASLAAVLGYLHADVVEDACAHIPVARDRVGPDGLIADPGIRGRVADVVEILLHHAATRPDPGSAEGS